MPPGDLTALRQNLHQCTELRAEAISRNARQAWMVDVFADEEDPILEIVEHICWSAETVSIGLAGGSGVGKTTQLFRLVESLWTDQHIIALRIDYEDYSSLSSPPDITDFLLSIVGGMVEEARRANVLPDDWNDERINAKVIGLLKRLSFESEIGAGPVSIKASLRDDESFRRRLRDHLSGQVAQLVREVRDFVAGVVQAIKQWNVRCRKVVLIVDSTERLSAPASAEVEMQTAVRNLFIQNGENLEFPDLSCIYLLPPWLPISDGGCLRFHVVAFPTIRVAKRDGSDDDRGIGLMIETIRKRMPNIEDLIRLEDLWRLSRISGGVHRVFFLLLKGIAGRARRARSIPIDGSIVDTVIDSVRQDYLAISMEAAPALRLIDSTKGVDGLGETSLSQLGRYFQALVVLQVANGEKWYTIHPLMKSRLMAIPISDP